MPEEPENLSEYEAMLGEPIVPAEPTPEEIADPAVTEEPHVEPEPEPKHVPASRFNEVWQERQALKQKADDLESYNRQMQLAYIQQMQTLQRNAMPGQKPVVDPELEEVGRYLAPWLQEQMKPLVSTIQQQNEVIRMLQGDREVQGAFQYVQNAVPEFVELLPDLEKWLDAKPPHVRQRITADPDLIINEALIVREMKRVTGGNAAPPVVKTDARSRAKVEGPGSSGTSPVSKPMDVGSMTDTQFQQEMRKAGFF